MRRPTSPLAGLPPEVGVLAAVAFSVAVGFGIVAPAIPLFAKEFGVGTTAAGGVVSVFAAMRLVSALGSGRLVDRLGERRVLGLGIGIVAVSSAVAGLAQTYTQLLLLRGVGGIGSAMFTVSAMSLLLRSVPAGQRGRASGVFSGGFLIGGITGPAFGGLVTGLSLRAPFFLYAATLGVAGTVGLLKLPRTSLAGAPLTGAAESRTTLAEALALPAYRSALVAMFANSWAVFGVRAALVPLFVVEVLDRGPVWTGIGFMVGAVASGAVLLPAGRVADASGRRPVVITGCAVSAAGMALLALDPAGLVGYLVAMSVIGLGAGLLNVAPAAVVGDVVAGRGGTTVAAFQMAGDLGSVTGPLVAGLLVDSFSYGTAFLATAGILALAGLLAVAAPETRRAPVSATAG